MNEQNHPLLNQSSVTFWVLNGIFPKYFLKNWETARLNFFFVNLHRVHNLEYWFFKSFPSSFCYFAASRDYFFTTNELWFANAFWIRWRLRLWNEKKKSWLFASCYFEITPGYKLLFYTLVFSWNLPLHNIGRKINK